MSRTRFWTILLGDAPTSFRASDHDTLVPTLKQLQRHSPGAVIRWYERGQLFESPEAARAAFAAAVRERRPREWRPGGDHRDPRARFKKPRDEKRRAFKLRARGRPSAETKGPQPRERPPDARHGKEAQPTRPRQELAGRGENRGRPESRTRGTRPRRRGDDK